ncbi:hypothetical protein BGZ99_001967, partial [Dissophora globulifera]
DHDNDILTDNDNDNDDDGSIIDNDKDDYRILKVTLDREDAEYEPTVVMRRRLPSRRARRRQKSSLDVATARSCLLRVVKCLGFHQSDTELW